MSELLERFERLRQDAPDRPLIIRAADGSVVTAQGLADQLEVLALALERAGQDGGPVLSLAGNTPTGIALLLACRRIGVPLLPVDRSVSVAEVEAIAQRFGARLVVCGAPVTLDASRETARLPDGLKLLARAAPLDGPRPTAPDIGVMKLTSGSTGVPRATLTTDANMVADAAAIMEAMDIRPTDVQMAAIPLSHAYGLGNLTLPLLLQGTAIVVRDGFVPHQFPEDAARFGITMFPGVPFMFDHLLQHLPAANWPRGVTRLITAGARIEAQTVERFHAAFGLKIHSFYGTSETGGICYDDGPAVDAEPTVGRPMPQVTVTLLPEEGAPADGGRVHVAGPAVARGYASGGSLTLAEADDDSPFQAGGFLTGDLGRFDERHHLELHGRVSSFVNVAGRKVQPQEVEAVLRTAPDVSDVKVLGAPDPRRGQQLVACIVPAGHQPAASALRTYLASRLAPFKIPRQFVFLERIPLTERGKLDRARLEAIVARHLSGEP